MILNYYQKLEEKVASTCEINNQTPKIQYPCEWEYKVILLEDEDVKSTINCILLNKLCTINASNKSKQGKYQSYNIKTLVMNEDERKMIFETLKQNDKIKYVL